MICSSQQQKIYDRPRRDKTGLDEIRPGETRKDTRLDKIRQETTRQDRLRQDKTDLDMIRQA